jgi:hypothetical protein
MKSNGENNPRLRLRFKDYKREKIQMDVDKYLASGGKITYVPVGVSKLGDDLAPFHLSEKNKYE